VNIRVQKKEVSVKKFVGILLALGLLVSFSFSSLAKELKIGYVNFFEVFNEYKKTKEYDDNLSKKQEEKEKQLKQKGEDIEKMESKVSLLKEKEKEKEMQKLEAAKKDFSQMFTQARGDIKKERDEKMKEIVEDLEKAIKEYAKKNNYDFIIHGSAILYADKAADVTADILKAVNSSYKK
jgi:Skp family chaperone for outer membrane proteins